MDYKATVPLEKGLEYMELALDVHSSITGEIQAISSEKKIKICSVPIPLANGAVCVDTELYLKFSLDGSISFEADVPMEFGCVYERDKGFRKHGRGLHVDSTAKVDCKAQSMLGLEPVLKIFELGIVDVEVEEGVEANAELAQHENGQVCSDISIATPILSIKVCGDDENKTILKEVFKVAIECNIYTAESDEIWHAKLHFEVLPDGTKQFVDECTYGADAIPDNNANTEDKQEKKDNNDSVISDVSRFYGYDLPLQYVVGFEETDEGMLDSSSYVIDNGDSYTVTGSLSCAECIPNDILQDIMNEIGAQYTSASGKVYTVQSTESYNNDQRQKVTFECSDGEVYEIVNIPSFEMDEYGRVFNSFHDTKGNAIITIFNDVVLNIPKNSDTEGFFNNIKDVDWSVRFNLRFNVNGDIDLMDYQETGFWFKKWSDDNIRIGTLD